MPMTVTEFRQLKATMMLATSPVDAEALTALRRANAVIARHGYTWTQVLDRVVKVEVPIEAAGGDDEDELSALFERAMMNASGSFLEMLESIHEKWEATGFLTPRQRDVVTRAAAGR